MNKKKKERLEKAGWQTGSVRDFLELTPEEEAFIELKLVLSKLMKTRRQKQRITQVELAKVLHSSQSRPRR